ncbi:MAG: MBL fold metallo-hydrolase [Phycisphaeraceae bacterium]|nr:MBL fold metallo-hydrolase [Phycisphaerales bacterium]MCB9861630.1 MBL fold metallo-hydrolase [Phycisphaeraceae bacterium]
MGRSIERIRALSRHWGWMIAEHVGMRQPEPVLVPTGSLPEREAWDAAQFGAFWFGQATTLLRVNGTTILTDPHFGDRAGTTVYGRQTGRKRSTALPGSIEDLPQIDVVLLSHAHMDHWHKASLERLANSHSSVVIPKNTRRLLPHRGRHFGHIMELDWEHTESVSDLGIHALPCKHWGARFLLDVHRGYNAYVIEADNRKLVFAADTAETDSFDHLSGIDTVIMGIGNYYVPWDTMHATPEQASAMAERMGARRFMPVHHSTFRDPSEPMNEPIERLKLAWQPKPIICERIGDVHLE